MIRASAGARAKWRKSSSVGVSPTARPRSRGAMESDGPLAPRGRRPPRADGGAPCWGRACGRLRAGASSTASRHRDRRLHRARAAGQALLRWDPRGSARQGRRRRRGRERLPRRRPARTCGRGASSRTPPHLQPARFGVPPRALSARAPGAERASPSLPFFYSAKIYMLSIIQKCIKFQTKISFRHVVGGLKSSSPSKI